MISFLLKKALPFTLTFVFGAGLGSLFNAPHHQRGCGRARFESFESSARPAPFDFDESRGRRECHMRRHNLVAETKPLIIIFKPVARWPRGVDRGKSLNPVNVSVTFGADGKVQRVEPVGDWPDASRGPEDAAVWESLERAARLIQFTPETINSIPVSVTKTVELDFVTE